MGFFLDDGRPIFQQIAERIEDDIIEQRQPEGSQIPSTNQFASFYQINPATAAKRVNLLVKQGILYKKRGIALRELGCSRERKVLQPSDRGPYHPDGDREAVGRMGRAPVFL